MFYKLFITNNSLTMILASLKNGLTPSDSVCQELTILPSQSISKIIPYGKSKGFSVSKFKS